MGEIKAKSVAAAIDWRRIETAMVKWAKSEGFDVSGHLAHELRRFNRPYLDITALAKAIADDLAPPS